jgi:hypothetical protein
MGHALQHYLVTLQTRRRIAPFDCAGNERLVVFATAMSRGTSELGAASSATTDVCSLALRNTSDDPEALDLAVRRFDPTPLVSFSAIAKLLERLHAQTSRRSRA